MNTVLRTVKVWVLGAAVLAVAVPAAAQQPAAPQPAAPVGVLPQNQPMAPYVVGQAKPPSTPGSPMIDMTLEDAMAMALEKNLDLKAARLTPQGVDYQLQAARAAFNPRFTGTYGYNNQSTPVNNTVLDPTISSVVQVRQTFNTNMTQVLPYHNMQVGATFNNNRQTSNSNQVKLNPTYGANLSANFAMPLLAGFKIDTNRNTLRTTAVQRQIADIQLQATIENTKAAVRTAYWNLRQAIEQIEIQQRSLDLANRLFQDNKVKVEIGTMAPIDTVQSEAQVALAEQGLLGAQVTWQTAELAFKRLLADGPTDPLVRQTINPTEQPVITPQKVDIPTAVNTAMQQRTDINQSKKTIEISQLSLQLSKDQTKPDFSFSTSYQLTGQGGPPVQNGIVIGDGGYIDALHQLRVISNPTWNMQFTFAYPLGMAAAKANYARAILQYDQSQAQLKAQELSVSADVANAGLAVDNTYKQFQAAQKNREAQERNTDAEQTRFDVGMSTNYAVVQAQNTLTLSRLSELRAVISYLNAVAEFDRIQRVGR